MGTIFYLSLFINYVILSLKIRQTYAITYSLFILISTFIFYIFYFEDFSNDSFVYFQNTKIFFQKYDLVDYLNSQNLPFNKQNIFSKIYLFFYTVFYIFGDNEVSLLCFTIIIKSSLCIYLINFLSRQYVFYKSKNYLFVIIFLFEPWSNYYFNFFFLKEIFIFLFSIINLVTFFKLTNKFKIRYILIVFITCFLLYFTRFYIAYLFIIFYITYFFYKNIKVTFKSLLFIISCFILIISALVLSEVYYEIKNILLDSQINFINPIKYLFSPLFINILIYENSIFRLLFSLISNFISIMFILSLIFYDYKNKFINFIILFIFIISFSQIFSIDQILTGGRHRILIYWLIAVIINYVFEKKKKKD